MEKYLELINTLIGLVGPAMTLAEAKTWVESKENWQHLRAEGHEDDGDKEPA